MMIRRVVYSLAVPLLLCAALADAQSVTRSTFNQLTRVQEMIDAGDYAEARPVLEALVIDTREIPYDFAVSNQYLAHVSVIMDDVARARAALHDALEIAELPLDLRTNLNLFYGTVLLGDGEYELARIVLDEWFAAEKFPEPSQIFSAAYANYMSGKLERAESLITRVLALSANPKESWYQLHYQVLFDLRKYDDAAMVLEGMITRNPSNASYWRMLVSHYMQLERSDDALAVFMVAYQNDLIDRASDLEQIIAMYGHIDVPEKGARLLDGWIAAGHLDGDAETLKRLGNLWLLARERPKALAALQKAAELAPDGRTFEMLGGIYFEEEDWERAHAAYRNALRAGGLDDRSRTSLLAGISAFRAGNKEDARQALRNATASDEYREQAESVLRQLDEA